MRLAPYVSHMHSKEVENNESAEYYNEETGKVIAHIMYHYNDKYECIRESKIQLAQTYSLKKGLRVLGNKGEKTIYQEINQIQKNYFWTH